MTEPSNSGTQLPPSSDRGIQFARLLVWPLVFLAVLFLFQDKIAPRDFSLNETGIKISFYLLEAEKRGGPSNVPPERPPNARDIQDTARKASEIDLSTRTVLWVDDNPKNNEFERQALAALGVRFTLARSTAEAAPLLRSHRFDLVVTDFKRADDPQGGYTLLDEIKKTSPAVPVIIYSGSAIPEFEREARERGAFAETNQPQRLLSLSVAALTATK